MIQAIRPLLLSWAIFALLVQAKAGQNPSDTLVDLESLRVGFVFDIRYATPNNFTGKILYPVAKAYLQPEPATALVLAQKDLQQMGLGLKIFDAYRPLPVQRKMWDLIQDERYVSNPDKMAGRHTRGTSVDVTLVDAKGRELSMPSGYDDFSEKAHGDFARATPEQIKNRSLLKQVMEKHGFTVLPTEWWHFDFKNWQNYPPMDIPLEKIEKKKPGAL